MISFVPFLIRNRFGVAMPKVLSFFEAVRLNEGSSLPIGVAGFCWGAKHAVVLAQGKLASSGKALVDACFVAHPSGVEIPADLETVIKPLSLAAGDQDFVTSLKEIERWRSVTDALTVDTEVQVYSGAGHGFAIRADPKSERIMEQSDKAEHQAVNWFEKHFAKCSYSQKM
jgi:dienelactone hydrolase